MDWAQFRQLITTRFDTEELRNLCFDLDVDYDSLRGEGKEAKVRELVAQFRRNSRIPELVAELSKARPDVSWDEILSESWTGVPEVTNKRNLWLIGGVFLLLLVVGLGLAAIIMSNTGPQAPTSAPSAETEETVETPLTGTPDCVPSAFSELPPQSMAIIKPDDGAKSRAPADTLEYEKLAGLRLASGLTIDFKRMKSFELSNKDFLNHFTADVNITFLDCTTWQDVIESESGSFLTGDTELGPIELYILDVERVDFEW